MWKFKTFEEKKYVPFVDSASGVINSSVTKVPSSIFKKVFHSGHHKYEYQW